MTQQMLTKPFIHISVVHKECQKQVDINSYAFGETTYGSTEICDGCGQKTPYSVELRLDRAAALAAHDSYISRIRKELDAAELVRDSMMSGQVRPWEPK